MKKLFAGLLLGGLFGAAVGFAAGIFAFPYIFLADIEARETLADGAGKTEVAVGAFIHADPDDPIHRGGGSVTVYGDALLLGADFEVGPGPKYHVYLVPLAEVTPATKVDETAFVDLGQLRAFKGSQVFPLPAGLSPRDYGSVVIWCAQFDVLISPAKLMFRDAAEG
jgi:hypothetical protein